MTRIVISDMHHHSITDALYLSYHFNERFINHMDSQCSK